METYPIMEQGILQTIGHTPLVKLERITEQLPLQLYAKLEMFNPGGSVKDRPAFNMLKQAMQRQRIDTNTTIIESSSGNLGIGLAQVCAFWGMRLICVVDAKTTQQNLQILRTYGAEVQVITEPDPATGDYLPARLQRVKYLLDTIPNSFWTNQYANLDNACAHHQTMQEIVDELGEAPDYLFCTTGSCGTLRGCADYIHTHHLKTHIIAVDAKGSVIFGDKRGKRLVPGHGAARVPELFHPHLSDEHLHVSDVDCIQGCRHLLRKEAVFAGGSSGGVISAFLQKSRTLRKETTSVAILCDRGERYLDTVYSTDWVREHFGEIS